MARILHHWRYLSAVRQPKLIVISIQWAVISEVRSLLVTDYRLLTTS